MRISFIPPADQGAKKADHRQGQSLEMRNVNIRKALPEDAAAIEQLNRTYFLESGRDFLSLITSAYSEMVVVEEQGAIIAFSGLEYHDWNNTASLIDIFVLPLYRHQGVATRLLRHLIGAARATPHRCLLAEAPALNPLLHLYLKNGFRICGYNDRYYSNSGHEAAMFLSLDLQQG